MLCMTACIQSALSLLIGCHSAEYDLMLMPNWCMVCVQFFGLFFVYLPVLTLYHDIS